MYPLEPATVGDVVLYDYSSAAISGRVVQRLSYEYVLVRWDDGSCASAHRDSSLRVIGRPSARGNAARS